jgi:hypothetical protein
MTEKIILIAGEADGRELTINRIEIRIRMPAAAPLSAILTTDQDAMLEPLPILDYDLILDDWGQPSRDDQGRLRYQLSTVAPDPLEPEWRLAKYFGPDGEPT